MRKRKARKMPFSQMGVFDGSGEGKKTNDPNWRFWVGGYYVSEQVSRAGQR